MTQQRAELEKPYDLLTAADAEDLYAPYYNEMLEQAATVLAANFTVDEMHQIEAFYRQPVGQKLEQDGGQERLVLISELHCGHEASRHLHCLR